MAKLSLCVCMLVTVLLPVGSLYAGDSCFVDDRAGTCTRLEKCQPLLMEIRKAGNPMPGYMRKKLQDLRCGFEYDEPVVCCIQSDCNNDQDNNSWYGDDSRGGKPKPTSSYPSVTPTITSKPIRDTDNKHTPSTNVGTNTESRLGQAPNVQKHRNLPLLPTECGASDSDRVLGGNRTSLYEMPWMVLLAYDSARGRKLSCGGTLISEWYVLTAAHCVSFLGDRLKLSEVILGEHDVRKDPDCDRVRIHNITKLFCAPNVKNATIDTVIPHPGYSPSTLVDDIALIRLSEPADFTLASMKPVCLPLTPELQNEDLVGKPGIVTGWGATEDGLQTPVLLSVDLPIVGNKECLEAYNGSPKIYDRQMCAGGVQDKDSCGGDSGGPLMYPGELDKGGVRYVQRGIVSYGSKRCGIGGFPGVYTRVAYYMDWILDNMQE